jgi:tetratricopeptide (TPR) repeat protein
LKSSQALHRKLGNRYGESEALTTLGGLAARQGRFEEAEGLLQQSLSITAESTRMGTAFAWGSLGLTRFISGRFAEAEAPLGQCLAIHRDLGMWGYSFTWRSLLGRVYLHQGKYGQARLEAQRVLSRARELDHKQGVSEGLMLLGELALAEGAFSQAAQHLEESPIAVHLETFASREFGQLAILGLTTLGLDRRAEAREHLVAALAWAQGAHHFPGLMLSLAGLALLSASEGRVERAVELYALASRYPFVANSRWFADVVGQHIAAASAPLAPNVIDAARERGQARELDASVAELLKEHLSQDGPLGS